MVARKRLTDAAILRLARPKTGERIEIWDRDPSGFGLRITPSRRAWQLLYRFKGQQRRESLGFYYTPEELARLPDGQRGKALTLADARKRARTILDQAKAGIDPEQVEKAAKAAEAKAEADTFAAVRTQFVEGHLSRLRSRRDIERYLRDDLAAWDDRPIKSITKRDIIAAVELKARTSGGHASNRLRAHLMRMLRWCAARDIVDAVPVLTIDKAPEPPRERVLTEGEIAKLWPAWEAMGWPYGSMLQVLLATGQRRGEVAGMKWRAIHAVPLRDGMSPEGYPFTAVGWTWELAAAETKTAKPHSVPLSDVVLGVLADLPRTTSAYVFPAPRPAGDQHAADFYGAKRRCDELCPEVAGWRFHDCRRSAASAMTQLGISVHTVGKVLNHSNGGSTTSRVYDRHSYAPEMRHALDVWGKRLAAIAGLVPAPEMLQVIDLVSRKSATQLSSK